MALSHYDVARRWAQQKFTYSKSSSMIHDGEWIFSWGRHWPLGRTITLSDSGRRVALVNKISHTSSTNRHCGKVSYAAWRELGVANCHSVDGDYMTHVIDEATLADAERWSRAAAEERRQWEVERRRQRARDNREWAVCAARSWFRDLGLDLSWLSDSRVVLLQREVQPSNERLELVIQLAQSSDRNPKTFLTALKAHEHLFGN